MNLALVIVLGLAFAALAGATMLGVRLIEQRHPPGGTFVPVTGGRLHVLDIGPTSGEGAGGPPIVLLHGASGNLEDMRIALGERLARRHRVIVVDRPGHGWSDRPAGDVTPARQAALIAEALDRLGVERAIFVGHSWSGALVMALALAHPARAAGLVLLAPVTHAWPGGISWHYRLATAPVIGRVFVRTVAMPVGLLLLPGGARGVFAPQAMPDGYVARAAISLVLRPGQFLANARDVAGLHAFVAAQAPRYRDVGAPIAIITGDRDATVSPRIHARALAAALPHAKLTMLPGVGHMPHHAASDVVIAEIERIAAAARTSQPEVGLRPRLRVAALSDVAASRAQAGPGPRM